MPAGLRDDTLAGIDEQDDQARSGCAGHRVAGVLHMPWRVGQHKRTRRSGEVAVGDIDRDALLAFGAQTVDEQRQIRLIEALVDRGAGDRVDLVGQYGLGVVQQPADEGRLAVVHTAGSGQTQQIR